MCIQRLDVDKLKIAPSGQTWLSHSFKNHAYESNCI